MAYTFENREIASRAGKKSRRGGNQFTHEAKDLMQKVTNRLLKDVMEGLDDLSTKDKANFLSKIMDFTIPKQRAVDSEISISSMGQEEMAELLNNKLREHYTNGSQDN